MTSFVQLLYDSLCGLYEVWFFLIENKIFVIADMGASLRIRFLEV